MEAYKYLSRIYDECMYDVDYKEWYGYIKSLLDSMDVSGEVLEMACGTGNITKYLAKDYDVIAADSSPEMLDVARAKLSAAGRKAKLVCADMREFLREKKCSAVVSAMDGVNYLTEDAGRFFECAYENLSDGGVILFDVSSEHKLRDIIGDDMFYDDGDDCTYLWTNEIKGNLLYMNIVMFVREGRNYERADEQHVQRIFTEEEITGMLKKAGFSEIRVFDFMTQNSPDETSERLQFMAVK